MVELFFVAVMAVGQADLEIDIDNPGGKPKAAAGAKAPAGEQPAAKNPADGEKPAGEDAPPTDAPQAKPENSEEGADEEGSEEEAAAEPEGESELSKFFDKGAIGLLLKGGVFMWPILIMGIVAAGVIVERYRSLKMLRTDTGGLRRRATQLLREDRVEEAYRLCETEQGPVPAVLSAGLRKYLVLRSLDYDPAKIEEQVVKAMDDYGVHIVAALERHLPILATISSVSPMLGFLGTVQGMIVAFNNILEKVGQADIVTLAAEGISIALLTTCFGLIVGIPAFIAFNYFTSVINRFVLDVEETATELIEVVTLQVTLQGVDSSGAAAGKTKDEAENVSV